MESFSKTGNCPASEALAGYQNLGIESVEVRRHLATCEFCSAELEFYSRFPPREEKVGPTPMIPKPLFELAESLLRRKRNVAELYKLAGKGD